MGLKHSANMLARWQDSEQRARLRAGIAKGKRGNRNAAGPRKPEFRARMAVASLGNTNSVDAPVKGECVYCGAPAQTRDHVIPRSRGGTNDPSNIVDCCFTCNRSKRNRTPDEWLAGIWP